MTLRAAIEGLYARFRSYPRRPSIVASPLTVRPREQATLARVPLRTLSGEQLSRYAFKAMTTWGEAADYKHFLPRILELAASPDGQLWPGLDLTRIARKLRLAGWSTWPKQERAAVHGFFMALWQTVLAHDPRSSSWPAPDVLLALASLFDDPTPFLDAWHADGSLPSALQLADFLAACSHDLARRAHLRGPWTDAAGREAVERWLSEPARREFLERAFERFGDHPAAHRLAEGIDAWERVLRRNP